MNFNRPIPNYGFTSKIKSKVDHFVIPFSWMAYFYILITCPFVVIPPELPNCLNGLQTSLLCCLGTKRLQILLILKSGQIVLKHSQPPDSFFFFNLP